MAFLSLVEIFDSVMMTAVVGYLFSDMFKRPYVEDYDPLKSFKYGIDMDNFKYAVMITAPAIILHELGHKFIALSYGLEAQFQAAWMFLILALVMKLMNFGFIFIVPAYVAISGHATPLQFGMTAFAGPAVNLALWLGAAFALKKDLVSGKYNHILAVTSKINMFLFIFNMLPIPGFDGSKVFMGLIRAFF